MYFDRAQEELEIEWNSQFDYVHETNYGMVESTEMLEAEARAHEEEWLVSVQDEIEARGPDYFSFGRPFSDEIPF